MSLNVGNNKTVLYIYISEDIKTNFLNFRVHTYTHKSRLHIMMKNDNIFRKLESKNIIAFEYFTSCLKLSTGYSKK